MSWQKCPICNGTGLQESIGSRDKFHPLEPCRICNGTAIIDEMTGLPPARMNNLELKRNMFDAAIESVRKDNPNGKPIMEEQHSFIDPEVELLKNALENESKCFDKKDMVSFAMGFSLVRMMGGIIEPYQELENWIKSQNTKSAKEVSK